MRPTCLSESNEETAEDQSTGLPASMFEKIATAIYISQIAGELATLARNAEIHVLTYLLARAQIEAELWSRGIPVKD